MFDINNNNYSSKLYFQWSHDNITFDFTNGKWPSGSDSGFTWEDSFIPSVHTTNNKQVTGHVWKREKLGLNGKWGLPYKIGISVSDLLDIDQKILDGLTVTLPIELDNYEISHSNEEGYKHIPVGGIELDILSKGPDGTDVWINQSELNVDLSNYYDKDDLDTGSLDVRYYTEDETDGLFKYKADVNHSHFEYVTKDELEYPNVDLTKYYTKVELDSKFSQIVTTDTVDLLWENIIGPVSNNTNLQTALNEKEDVISKNTGFNLNLGTVSGTVSEGDHLHTGIYKPDFTENNAFNLNFGTSLSTVSEGNHTHTVAGTNTPSAISAGVGWDVSQLQHRYNEALGIMIINGAIQRTSGSDNTAFTLPLSTNVSYVDITEYNGNKIISANSYIAGEFHLSGSAVTNGFLENTLYTVNSVVFV